MVTTDPSLQPPNLQRKQNRLGNPETFRGGNVLYSLKLLIAKALGGSANSLQQTNTKHMSNNITPIIKRKETSHGKAY
jgi:hypothetical protein